MEYRLIKNGGNPQDNTKTIQMEYRLSGSELKGLYSKMKDISFNEESEPIYSWEDGEDYITHGDFDLEVKENNK